MDYDSFLELAKNRRTIRRFRPDPVPDDSIDKIIEAARWAPSGFNMQPWEFVVIRDGELRKSITGWIQEYHKLIMKTETVREEWQRVPYHKSLDPELDYKNAPVYILLLGDTRLNEGLPTSMKYDAERLQSILTSSLANAYLYMALAAETLGLASEWVSSVAVAYPHCMTKALLGIPPEMRIYDMMAVGYPAYRLTSKKLLRDTGKMVHYDRCGEDDFRTDEEVDDYIKRARVWTMANHRRGADKKMMG